MRGKGLGASSLAILGVQVVMLVAAVANNFLTAHLGGPDGKGILYSVQLTSNLGLAFLHFCLGSAAVLFLRQNTGTREEIASGMLIPSMLLGATPVAILAVSWHWSAHYLAARMSPMALWMGLSIIPALVLTYNVSYFFLGDHKLWQYNALTAAGPLALSVALAALFVFHQGSVRSLIIAWCATVLLPSMIAAGMILRAARGRLLPSFGLFRRMYQFGWRCHVAQAVQLMQYRAPVILVAFLLPIAQLGIYSLSVSMVEMLWYIPNALSVALMPHVAGSSKEEASRLTPMICRITLAVTALLGVMLAGLCSFAIPMLLPRFTGSLKSLWILVPGVVVAGISRVLASDLSGRGEPLRAFYPAVAGLAAEIGLGVYFVPQGGLTAAAVVTGTGYLLGAVLQVWVYCRVTGVRPVNILFIQSADVANIFQAVRHRVVLVREMLQPTYVA
jgi:O-antigen/teichoic acid export membrane protein